MRDARNAAPSCRGRRLRRAVSDEMDVLTITTLGEATIKELRAATLPAIHAPSADVLDAVLDSGLRFTGDVVRVDAGCVMCC